jgi:acyl carrier protein
VANVSDDHRESIILDILAKEFDVPLEKLQPSVSLIQDLGADSLALINVMMQAEESLGIEISEDEWRSLTTVGDILARLRSQVQSPMPQTVEQQ